MHLLYDIFCAMSDIMIVEYSSPLTVFMKTDFKIPYNLNAVRSAQ